MATRGTGADMSRNQSLAGQTVKQGDYAVTYDDNGYATKAINTKHELFSDPGYDGIYAGGNFGFTDGTPNGTGGGSSSGGGSRGSGGGRTSSGGSASGSSQTQGENTLVEMNPDHYRALGMSLMAQLNAANPNTQQGKNNENAAIGNLQSRWDEMSEAQKQGMINLFRQYGIEVTP